MPVEKWNAKAASVILEEVMEKLKPKPVRVYHENGMRITVYEERSCEK